MVAAMAVLRQGTAAALKIGRAHVIEHQHPVLQVPPRQAVLDAHLAIEQPIERLVRLALLAPGPVQNRAQARGRRLLVHRPHEPELRARRDQPVDDHRDDQIALAPRDRVLRRAQDQPIERQLTDHAERRRNVAVRQGALDLQLSWPRADHRPASKQCLQASDDLPRQLAQIGKRPLLRSALFVAIALPQQHCRRRVSVRHRFDEHAAIESHRR